MSVTSIRIKAMLVLAILLASTGIMSGYAALQAETVPFDVIDSLEVLAYESDLSLYPGETLQFNVTVENHASVACTASLSFSLNDTIYQQNYVTFSSNIYTVAPGTNTLNAWLSVTSTAPEAQLKLTVQIIQDEDSPPTPNPSPTPHPIEFPISMDLFVAGAKWAANGNTSVLYINWYDNYCAHHASDGAAWGPWWREGQQSEVKNVTVEALEQQGFTVTCMGDVPANISSYSLVIFEASYAIEPKHVEQVRDYMANGGNVVILSGVPCYFATYCKTLWPYRVGGTDLTALKDWFGSARFVNRGGSAYLVVDKPFGMSLLNQSLVYYINASGSSALTQMSSDSKIIARWDSGAVYAFTHEYGNGRMYYQAEIDWSKILTPFNVHCLTLDPANAINPVNTTHTVTASVRDVQTNNPIPNQWVTFNITDGPNKGLNGSGTTNANGETTFSWNSSLSGTDILHATTAGGSNPQDPNITSIATKTWAIPGPLSASITPSNWTMNLGQTNLFMVTPHGGSLNYTSYQWYVNGSAQKNQNVATYIFIPNATGCFLITATVTDSTNEISPQSDNATVIVNDYLNVTIAPVGPLTMNSGENQVFIANATGGSGEIHYQWNENAGKAGTDNSTFIFFAASSSVNITCAATDNASIPNTVLSNTILININGSSPTPSPASASSGGSGSSSSSDGDDDESSENSPAQTPTDTPSPTPTPPDQFPEPVFLFNFGWVEIAIITLMAIILALVIVVTFRSFK